MRGQIIHDTLPNVSWLVAKLVHLEHKVVSVIYGLSVLVVWLHDDGVIFVWRYKVWIVLHCPIIPALL